MEQTFEDYKEIAIEDAKQAGEEVVLDLPKKIEPVSQPPSKIEKPAPIIAQENGMLMGGSLEQQYRLAKYYHQSNLMPKSLNSPEKILVALQICYELGLKPMASIGKIAVINGTPYLWGELPYAIVLKSGLLEEFKEDWAYDLTGILVEARCEIKRKDISPIVRKFTVEDAKKANLYKNDTWHKYERRMLQMRARSWAIKDAFPDVLLGMNLMEWDLQEIVDEKGAIIGEAPQSRLAEKLSE